MSVAIAWGAVARAQPALVDSLEWLAVDAPLIVRGRALETRDVDAQRGYVLRYVTVAVRRVYKGEADRPTLQVVLRVRRRQKAGKDWARAPAGHLFFLRPVVADGEIVQNLWRVRADRRSALDLTKLPKVVKADGGFIKTRAELLRIVRKWAEAGDPNRPCVGTPDVDKPRTGYLRLKVPPKHELCAELGGGVCYLNVPATEAHRAHAMALTQAEHYWVRARGADMLRNYPGPNTVERLKGLLSDDGQRRWVNRHGELIRVEYPVRRAAYDALAALGEKAEKPLLERGPTGEERKPGAPVALVARAARPRYDPHSAGGQRRRRPETGP
jgi:hypothetical protein